VSPLPSPPPEYRGREEGAAPNLSHARQLSNASVDAPLQIDTRPLIVAVVEDVLLGTNPATIARRFHLWVLEVIDQVCLELQRQSGLTNVVLSGGVFMNALLSGEAEQNLKTHGFRPFRQQKATANDGGLSLGQILVAASRLAHAPPE